MHLHGFYYRVQRVGDGVRDETVAGAEGRRVVTQMVPASGTLTIEWVPERVGNWLFHCHVMAHVAPERRLGASPSGDAAGGHIGDSGADPGGSAHQHGPHAGHGPHTGHEAHRVHDPSDPSLGMAGMVLGITVTDRDDAAASAPPAVMPATPRQLTMTIKGGSADGRTPAGIDVSGDGVARVASPGPPVVLRRGEPVEITLVNNLNESTSMHWHGLELDSYYDGVHGWSGLGTKVAPMIVPGESFTVRITPPRTGTFIYHTHLHDYRQTVVRASTDRWSSSSPARPTIRPPIHVIVLGRRGATPASSILNTPRPP